MKITELIKHTEEKSNTAFSFEVLPPIKGTGIDKLRKDIEKFIPFGPKYINITTHRCEPVLRKLENGLYERRMQRLRPGTVAVAAALQNEYGIPIVPHLLCSGFTKEETEYILLDLMYLGIKNVLLLRGDKAREETMFRPTAGGYSHTTELQKQVNDFNKGKFLDGTIFETEGEQFSYGVACYPEKHDESPNLESDMKWFKYKVEHGADYGVTQMFFDNKKYFNFIDKAKAMGITVPVIPGIKPLAKLSQINVLPKLFHCDLPIDLTKEITKCKSDDDIKVLGIEWCVSQCKELIEHGVPSIHFYMTGNSDSLFQIAKRLF